MQLAVLYQAVKIVICNQQYCKTRWCL